MTAQMCEPLEILHLDNNGSDLAVNYWLFTVAKQQHNL